MMDLAEWLRSIRLGQYEAAFRDNEIDGEVLRSLTGDDLKVFGVSLGGHRRKILTAIAELSAADSPAEVETGRTPPVADKSQAAAERRQLTVLFCDQN